MDMSQNVASLGQSRQATKVKRLRCLATQEFTGGLVLAFRGQDGRHTLNFRVVSLTNAAIAAVSTMGKCRKDNS